MSEERRKRYKIVPNVVSSGPTDSQSSSQDVVEVKVKQEVINLDDSDTNVPTDNMWSFVRQYTSELAKESVESLIKAKPIETSLSNLSRQFQTKLDQKLTMEQIVHVATQLPRDRMEFLKMMKVEMDRDNYKLFLIALSDYRKDMNFDLLSRRLLQVFANPRLFPFLVEMKRFLKEHHVIEYGVTIKEFMEKQLN